MMLEARARACFPDQYLLSLDGAPVGTFRARCFSSTLDVQLTEQRRLVFERRGGPGRRWVLKNAADATPLAAADRAGMLSVGWHLLLTSGPAEMRLGGWLWARRAVICEGAEIASFRYLPFSAARWTVEGGPTLTMIDLLLIGLVAHTALGLYSA